MNIKPGLYIVSTPIGNLHDITLRAIDILKNSDFIFCEDTRVSSKLLAKHDIKTPLKIYSDNSDQSVRELIKSLILKGKAISLISDAGTPLISDPGYKLIRDLKKEDLYIDVIPGPCAAIAGLALSGLPTDRFLFCGFLPKTHEGRLNTFKEVIDIDCTLIFYDTASRLLQSLTAAKMVLGNRQANIARELTKLYQESKTASLEELINYYTANPPKGEIIIIISKEAKKISLEEIKIELVKLLNKGLTAKSACDELYLLYKKYVNRKEIYKLATELKTRINYKY